MLNSEKQRQDTFLRFQDPRPSMTATGHCTGLKDSHSFRCVCSCETGSQLTRCYQCPPKNLEHFIPHHPESPLHITEKTGLPSTHQLWAKVHQRNSGRSRAFGPLRPLRYGLPSWDGPRVVGLWAVMGDMVYKGEGGSKE